LKYIIIEEKKEKKIIRRGVKSFVKVMLKIILLSFDVLFAIRKYI